MQFETRDQTPVCAVRFAQRSAFTTATRNLSKTAHIAAHDVERFVAHMMSEQRHFRCYFKRVTLVFAVRVAH
jgi:hypothetical protein